MYSESEACFEKAMIIWEKLFGIEHPNTIKMEESVMEVRIKWKSNGATKLLHNESNSFRKASLGREPRTAI